MNEIIKMLRGVAIIVIVYFGLLYFADKYFFDGVLNSATVLIGIIIPAGMLGVTLGNKFKKKA